MALTRFLLLRQCSRGRGWARRPLSDWECYTGNTPRNSSYRPQIRRVYFTFYKELPLEPRAGWLSYRSSMSAHCILSSVFLQEREPLTPKYAGEPGCARSLYCTMVDSSTAPWSVQTFRPYLLRRARSSAGQTLHCRLRD